MASAEFSTGYSQGKPTSRVLQPPGGGSSNIFGGYDDHQTNNKGGAGEAASYKPKTTKDTIFGGPEEAENAAPAKQTTSTVFSPEPEPARGAKQHPADEEEEDQLEEQENTPQEQQSEGKFAEHDKNLAASRGSFNPITGEAYAPPQKTVHTSTKVRQPPGGASSGLW